MLTIEDVKQVSFRRAGIGGYKPEDVDAFIDQVLITMEQMKKEKSDLVKKMDILATRVEEYRADEDAVRNALLASQKVADSTIKSAKSKAAQIIEESENAAKAKLYDLNIQIREQKKQYSLLVSECNKLRDELINACNKHIILAKELPSKTKVEKIERQLDERFPTEQTDEIERAAEVVQVSNNISSKSTQVSETISDDGKAEIASEISHKSIFEDNKAQNKTVKKESAPDTSDADENFAQPGDVNLIEDIDDDDVRDYDKKKKGKLFGVLKFGDDYDINNDTENDN